MNEIQLKLSEVIKMIDDEVRIDDDVSGGYLEEPFDKIVTKLYEIQEKLSERQESTEQSEQHENKALHIADVSKQRELLIDFSSHLNTYKGLEDLRFDFMVQDYIDKTKGNL